MAYVHNLSLLPQEAPLLMLKRHRNDIVTLCISGFQAILFVYDVSLQLSAIADTSVVRYVLLHAFLLHVVDAGTSRLWEEDYCFAY